MAQLSERQMQRFAGTYKVVPKVQWESLKASGFGNPDWASNYPLKPNGAPANMLTPRMAVKLFSDGCFILEKSEDNIKYLQDKLPECTHKYYKKKQWRKQLVECGRRVVCRIALGKAISSNCLGEDMFIHAIMSSAVELGWNRSRPMWEDLPETDKDRDLGRVNRVVSNDEIASLFREGGASDMNFKEWFKANNCEDKHMYDHIIPVSTVIDAVEAD